MSGFDQIRWDEGLFDESAPVVGNVRATVAPTGSVTPSVGLTGSATSTVALRGGITITISPV